MLYVASSIRSWTQPSKQRNGEDDRRAAPPPSAHAAAPAASAEQPCMGRRRRGGSGSDAAGRRRPSASPRRVGRAAGGARRPHPRRRRGGEGSSVLGWNPAGLPPAERLRRGSQQLARPPRGRRLVQHSQGMFGPQNDQVRFIQLHVAGSGILGADEQLNPYFYNWNRVYVRYCDGASFSGDGEGRAQDGSTLHFRGLRIYEAVIDELMEKGLANATQALLTGCSAGSLAAILHCDDFSARFPHEVSVKCFADAGFFLDEKDISGVRSFRPFIDGVVQLQNVRKVLPKDCLANKEPTECFFPAEVIKTIHTPMFILNSGYDSWQIRNIIVPDSSSPDNSWLSCKENIRNCNSTQIEALDGWLSLSICFSLRSFIICAFSVCSKIKFFPSPPIVFRNTMLSDMKVIENKEGWGMFIDSCFTHCQTLSSIAWNSPISPRLGNKTIAEAVGGWHSGRSQGVKDIDCECPRNPTCSSLLPP